MQRVVLSVFYCEAHRHFLSCPRRASLWFFSHDYTVDWMRWNEMLTGGHRLASGIFPAVCRLGRQRQLFIYRNVVGVWAGSCRQARGTRGARGRGISGKITYLSCSVPHLPVNRDHTRTLASKTRNAWEGEHSQLLLHFSKGHECFFFLIFGISALHDLPVWVIHTTWDTDQDAVILAAVKCSCYGTEVL